MPAGRPKVEWDDKDFRTYESLCAIQCTQVEICYVMGVTEKTLGRILKEHYGMDFSQCYKRFSAAGKMQLRRAQFRIAERNAIMAIFLGKQYLGQSDAGLVGDDEELDDGLLKALGSAAGVFDDEESDIPV